VTFPQSAVLLRFPMAHANVSNSVLTIIASFSNGLDVLKKLRRSRKTSTPQSRKKKRKDDDALRLSRSLRHGPEEIGREYQAGSMRCDSEQYALGDGKLDCRASRYLWLMSRSYRTDFAGRDPSQAEHWSCGDNHFVLESRQAQWARTGLSVFDGFVGAVTRTDYRCPTATLPKTNVGARTANYAIHTRH